MNKLARYIIIAVSIAIIAFLLWYFSEVVWYIVISAVLSIIGMPLVNLLARIEIRGKAFPRWLAATITLVVITALITLFFWTMIPLVSSQFHDLSNVDFVAVMNNFSDQINRVDAWIKDKLPSIAGSFSLRSELDDFFSHLLDAVSFKSILTSTTFIATALFVHLFSIFFITYFFLKEEDLFERGFAFFFPERLRDQLHNAMQSVNNLLVRYFIGLLVESTLVFILTAVGLLICGLPMQTSLVIGVLSGVLNVIPYVGAVIAFVISAAIVLVMAVSNATTMSIGMLLLLVGIVFLVVRLIDNVFLQTLIFANSAKAHPLEVFLVLLLAGYVAGILGMLLAIPAYNVLRVFAKEFFNNFEQVRRLTEKM